MVDILYAEELAYREYLQRRLARLETELERMKTTMADFANDEARLEADVQAETALIQQVQATLEGSKAQIETLTQEVTTLKAQGVDTQAMETALATLEANTTSLGQLVTPAPSADATSAASDLAPSGPATQPPVAS